MIGWEEIPIRFTVERRKDIATGKLTWHLMLKDLSREGSVRYICGEWDHEPTIAEVDAVTFATKQGISFMTTHLAVERRRVEVFMPKIRVRVVEEKKEVPE
jgi:hypothetical protein